MRTYATLAGCLAVALVMTTGCGGNGSSSTRHVSAQLKLRGTYATSTGERISPRAVDVIKAQLRGQAALRAQKSPAWARQLAKKFTRMGAVPGSTDRLKHVARETGKHPLDIVFESNVAVFAYDDSQAAWLDAQYVDPETGYYDLYVPEDSPVSLWFGTYDEVTGEAVVIAPVMYGWEYEIAPGGWDVYYEYDPYLWVDPEEYTFTDYYVAATTAQEGYYQLDWVGDDGSPGSAWFYLLPDSPEYGSYYLLWDDGTCVNGTQVYISFDTSGYYWSINGLDAPMTLSGMTSTPYYVEGTGRMTVVGDDGLTYYATFGMSYLEQTTVTYCWDTPPTEVVIPADPVVYTDGCDYASGVCCPPGCVPDAWYGICVIEITYDPVTGTGASCELVDVVSDVYVDWCPPGCALWSDGFCYLNGDPLSDICL